MVSTAWALKDFSRDLIFRRFLTIGNLGLSSPSIIQLHALMSYTHIYLDWPKRRLNSQIKNTILPYCLKGLSLRPTLIKHHQKKMHTAPQAAAQSLPPHPSAPCSASQPP